MFLHDFRFLSSASVLGFQLLSFCFFLSSFPPFSASQLASSVSQIRFSLFCSSSSFQPGFPCFLSDSKYLAFCLFPFVLPCFAPTAVPQVLPFWISPPGSALDFCFLSSTSVLASHYSAFCFFFSSFPLFPPHSWLLQLLRSAFAFLFFLFLPAWFPVLSVRF